MSDPNPYLAVEDALTREARRKILAVWEHLHPRWTGGHVAYILDGLCDSDSYLAFMEPYWERVGGDLAVRLGGSDGSAAMIVSASARAAILLLGLMDDAASGRPQPDVLPIRFVVLTGMIARAAVHGDRDAIGVGSL